MNTTTFSTVKLPAGPPADFMRDTNRHALARRRMNQKLETVRGKINVVLYRRAMTTSQKNGYHTSVANGVAHTQPQPNNPPPGVATAPSITPEEYNYAMSEKWIEEDKNAGLFDPKADADSAPNAHMW